MWHHWHVPLSKKGQTIQHVGVFLGSQQFFSHGQLYVALSRTTSPRRLSIYMSKEDKSASEEATMMNVVFKEVLICKCNKCFLPKDQQRYSLIDSGYSFSVLFSIARKTKTSNFIAIISNQSKSLNTQCIAKLISLQCIWTNPTTNPTTISLYMMINNFNFQ